MSLFSAYCAVVLSLSPQDSATYLVSDIFGWIFIGGAFAVLLWFTYHLLSLARQSRDQVLSDAEETRHPIALTKYKRMLVKK